MIMCNPRKTMMNGLTAASSLAVQVCGMHSGTVKWTGSVILILAAGWITDARAEMPAAKEVADVVAARLEKYQIRDGTEQGMWPSEPYYAGPPTTGLACAYEWMKNASYWQAAQGGGEYILWTRDTTGQLLGDEAHALMWLSRLSKQSKQNPWYVALKEFYDSLHPPGGETTAAYIDLLEKGQGDPSATVFYMAHHTIVAHYIGDADKDVWRSALIRSLSAVDDTANYPVQALGVATWALALTGDLDYTAVDTAYGKSYWSGKTLNDLPVLLMKQQVPEGEPFEGSFYWRFEHSSAQWTDTLIGGWTEDTVYGTLGLVAAATGGGGLSQDLDAAVRAAYMALLDAADAEGEVCMHLSGMGASYHAYAGELLQALWAAQQYLDARATKPARAEDGSMPATP